LNELSQEQKISLLKIKIDFTINGEFGGKIRFLVVAILGAFLTFTISGVGWACTDTRSILSSFSSRV
jgi:hypothetical protein